MTLSPQVTEVSLVLGGEAGQGLQTIGTVLARTAQAAGQHVLVTHEFMSRIRGGSNSTAVRIATTPVRATTDRIDVCVLLDADALPRLDVRQIDLGRRLRQHVGRGAHLVDERQDDRDRADAGGGNRGDIQEITAAGIGDLFVQQSRVFPGW